MEELAWVREAGIRGINFPAPRAHRRPTTTGAGTRSGSMCEELDVVLAKPRRCRRPAGLRRCGRVRDPDVGARGDEQGLTDEPPHLRWGLRATPQASPRDRRVARCVVEARGQRARLDLPHEQPPSGRFRRQDQRPRSSPSQRVLRFERVHRGQLSLATRPKPRCATVWITTSSGAPTTRTSRERGRVRGRTRRNP